MFSEKNFKKDIIFILSLILILIILSVIFYLVNKKREPGFKARDNTILIQEREEILTQAQVKKKIMLDILKRGGGKNEAETEQERREMLNALEGGQEDGTASIQK